MRKKFVYICSPCRGDYENNIKYAKFYCSQIMKECPDVIPIAPHVYFTQFLDDKKPTERSLGMEAGLALLDMCDEIWVYGLQNPSEGMQAEIDYALKNGIKIRDGYDLEYDLSAETKRAEEELGDALLVLPSHVGRLNGVAAIESTTVRISGEVITELAQALKRNRGSDITVEATNNPHVESCVCCGEIIPEGRQVCPTCEAKGGPRK